MHKAFSRRPRGLSWVTFLVLVLIAGGGWWLYSFGGAHWDNISIKSDIHEAANMCLKVKDDNQVRAFIVQRMNKYPNLHVAPEDVQIERNSTDSFVTIDVAYTRSIKPLFASEERTVGFTRHVEQDISPVKW